MTVFRSLLWCLVLAVIGAVAWEALSEDLGFVLIRWHGKIIETTVAYGLIFWLLLSVAAWSFWWLVRLPFNAWQNFAKKQSQQRFINGLQALHDGHYARAETLLIKASTDPLLKTTALSGARDAALKLNENSRAQLHQNSLTEHAPGAAAHFAAQELLNNGQSEAAIYLLSPLQQAQQLSPNTQILHVKALQQQQRANEAIMLLNTMRKQYMLVTPDIIALEIQLHSDALLQAVDADTFKRIWSAWPERIKQAVEILKIYALRADALGLEDTAVTTLNDALNKHWQPELLIPLASISSHSNDRRIALCEAWKTLHPNEIMLDTALGILYLQQQHYREAETAFMRAAAQNPSAMIWQKLGDVYQAQSRHEQASTAYSNALRFQNALPTQAVSGMSMREQIASEATVEIRNEHGLPLLPK
jgi:HemY protein